MFTKMCLKALKRVENIPIRVKLSWPRDQDSGRNKKCKKVERFKRVQNFIFNIWGGGEEELAKSHIPYSHELIQVLKWQNYGEEASKQCQISQLWQLRLSRHLRPPIPFAVLPPRLPNPHHPAPTGPRLFFGWIPRMIYSLATFGFSAHLRQIT